MVKQLCLLAIVAAVSSYNNAFAAGPSVGSDMWTSWMERNGLFEVHGDDCSGSEAFVAIDPYQTRGFCIETGERTAAIWEVARDDCMQDGKRLPEPAEWMVACANAGSLGLSNMTNNYEHISNFAITFRSSTYHGVAVPASGNGSCSAGAHSWVTSESSPTSRAYRCVR